MDRDFTTFPTPEQPFSSEIAQTSQDKDGAKKVEQLKAEEHSETQEQRMSSQEKKAFAELQNPSAKMGKKPATIKRKWDRVKSNAQNQKNTNIFKKESVSIVNNKKVASKKKIIAKTRHNKSGYLGENKYNSTLREQVLRKTLDNDSKCTMKKNTTKRKTDSTNTNPSDLDAKKVKTDVTLEPGYSPSGYSLSEIESKLWKITDPALMGTLDNTYVNKVNTVNDYVQHLGYELRGVKADGNCFFQAFMEGLETLPNQAIDLAQLPPINQVQDFRNIAADWHPTLQDRNRIKINGNWVTSDEGDLLAAALNIPIRIISVQSDGETHQYYDSLTTTTGERQTWDTLKQPPEHYVTIVDLGGHFIYAAPQNVSDLLPLEPASAINNKKMDLNSINLKRSIKLFNNILNHGILTQNRRAALGLQSINSADDFPNQIDQVKVNVLSSNHGVNDALFHRSKGAYTVALERENDPLNFTYTKNELPVDKLNEIGKNYPPDFVRKIIAQLQQELSIIPSDEAKYVLENRLMNSMLIVISLENLSTMQHDGSIDKSKDKERKDYLRQFIKENDRISCHELPCDSIHNSCFEKIILSDSFKPYINLITPSMRDKIIFVSSISETIQYNRTLREGYKITLTTPNFRGALQAVDFEKGVITHLCRGIGPGDA